MIYIFSKFIWEFRDFSMDFVQTKIWLAYPSIIEVSNFTFL